MELEKTERVNDLIDLYGSLLTENQLNILELYYMEDLSLKEIAEELGVSRNAIHDSLKRSINILEEYDSKLNLLQKDEIKNELLQRIDELNKEQIKEYIEFFERVCAYNCIEYYAEWGAPQNLTVYKKMVNWRSLLDYEV